MCFLRDLVNKMYFLTNAVTHRFKEKKSLQLEAV